MALELIEYSEEDHHRDAADRKPHEPLFKKKKKDLPPPHFLQCKSSERIETNI